MSSTLRESLASFHKAEIDKSWPIVKAASIGAAD